MLAAVSVALHGCDNGSNDIQIPDSGSTDAGGDAATDATAVPDATADATADPANMDIDDPMTDAAVDVLGDAVGPRMVDPAVALPPRPDVQTCRLGSMNRTQVDADVPPTIAETGCYVGPGPLQPGPDLVPYDVRSPLWTDGAFKTRYLVVPPGERIRVHEDGAWELPVGTILVKTFAYDRRINGEVIHLPVETRFMVRRELGWTVHTYRWNDTGTDASLLREGGVVTYEVDTSDGPRSIDYAFPDETQCGYCHIDSAELVLGVQTPQLARSVEYTDGVADQLAVFAALGLFEGDEPPTTDAPRPDPFDPNVPLEDRARSYLDVNCAHCHQPGGWRPPEMTMDLRWERSLEDALICGEPLQFESVVAQGSMRIAPGNLDESNLYQRMITEGLGRMPSLGTGVIDPAGADLIADWILSLDGCP